MINEQCKEMVKEVLEEYKKYDVVKIFIEHNIGNKDIVLAVQYGESGYEPLQDDFITIKEEESNERISEELFEFIEKSISDKGLVEINYG